jgi:hypothetical protein
VVSRGINIVLDHGEEQEVMMSSLFAYLRDQEVTSEQMILKGFERVLQVMLL